MVTPAPSMALRPPAREELRLPTARKRSGCCCRNGKGQREHGPLQREMISAIEPRLLDYPFIKPTRAERLRYRALDTLRALRLRQRLRRLR